MSHRRADANLLFAAFELFGSGASNGFAMGRFEFMPGVEKEGSPVYRQAHSKEIATHLGEILLYRWEKSSYPISSHLPHIRSGDEWLVMEEKHNFTALKASVGDDPTLPPSTGWKFNNLGYFEEDPSVICTRPAGSPPCSVTLKLSGLAKDLQGKCEGEYKDTGLRSAGRQVNFQLNKILCSFQTIDRCSNWRVPLNATSL